MTHYILLVSSNLALNQVFLELSHPLGKESCLFFALFLETFLNFYLIAYTHTVSKPQASSPIVFLKLKQSRGHVCCSIDAMRKIFKGHLAIFFICDLLVSGKKKI